MSNNGEPQSKRPARPAWLNVAILLGLIVVFFLMIGRFDENSPAEETVSESAITESSESQAGADDSASTEDTSAAAEGASAVEGDSEAASGEDAGPAQVAESAATEPRAGPPGMPVITEDELPPEALETIALIESDGPYPYSKDGSTFQNREGILPDEPMGYYSEYTVETPGSSDRGARRIVGGSDGELYYTDDHYDSFSWIILE